MVVPLIKSLRPHQWFKNLFVVAPLLFSKHLPDPQRVVWTVYAFLLFGLLSGSVYLVNDLFDIEKDREHPKKRNRPIPSGALPLAAARTAAAVLILVALGGSLAFGWRPAEANAGPVVGSMTRGLPFVAVAACYLVLNLAYSLALKHIPFVDVLTIAGGFLLRVLAGAVAISVLPSPWLLICTFVLAAFLGFGKRTHELATAGERAVKQRSVLSRYKLPQLKVILWIMAACTTAAYLFYTLDATTVAKFNTENLLYTTPFVAFGVIRFLRLVSNRALADSPTDEMLHDIPFMANMVLFVVATVSIIYFL